jgi:uridine kinase
MQPPPAVQVIGIAGPSASGKSALALALAEKLSGVVFPLDAYYRDQRGVPEDALNVDVPEALEHHLVVEHLRALVAGVPIQQPIYNYTTHTRAPLRRTVAPSPAIIVEGLFTLYWPEVRRLLSTSVFLALDHAECLQRRIARDARERGRTRTDVAYQYESKVRPMYDLHVHPTREHAQLVLDARAPLENLVSRVLRAVDAVRQGQPE